MDVDNRSSGGGCPSHRSDLAADVAVTLLHTLARLGSEQGTDADESLRRIAVAGVDSVPGAHCAGITVVGRNGVVRTVAATHPVSTVLDEVQGTVGEGPCLSAAWTRETIRVDDLEMECRWPRYRAAALERTPVRSVLSFRLFENGGDVGALNFYAETAAAFGEDSLELASLHAAYTAAAWTVLERERQFRSALASRDIIGQAKGLLMERFHIDAADAFGLLQRLSQESNEKLATIAERLVRAERPRMTTA